jgi:hypothetical protein
MASRGVSQTTFCCRRHSNELVLSITRRNRFVAAIAAVNLIDIVVDGEG